MAQTWRSRVNQNKVIEEAFISKQQESQDMLPHRAGTRTAVSRKGKHSIHSYICFFFTKSTKQKCHEAVFAAVNQAFV